MTVYGSKPYGSFKYGVASTTDISIYPFTAQSLDYGTIKLSWVYPTATAVFTNFIIVRNPLGFPITPDGGDLIYKSDKTTLTTAGPGSTSLLGTTATLTDIGSFYDPITGAATPTYTATTTSGTNGSNFITLISLNSNIKVGQSVTYTPSGYLTGANSGSGIVGGTTVTAINNTTKTLTLSNAAAIPENTVLKFTPTRLTPGKVYYYSAFVLSNSFWVRVGTALGTAVKNYNTADVMYNSLPQIYKNASSVYDNNRNNDLYNFLRIIGIEYDLLKTKIENAKNRYDVLNLNGKLLPALMDQMGLSYESGLGVQQGKRLVNNADYIYLNKGTNQGLKQFVKSFTGYPATIAPFTNLFLTLDCSSFEVSTGFWAARGTAIFIEKTTAAIEGGAPTPYAESNSPTSYPNSQLGYLKASATSVATGSNYIFRYGVSPDTLTISTFSSNDSTAGYSYITLTTDKDHGLIVGDTVVVQGMTPIYINGVWDIIATPDSRSFTFYNPSATTSLTIYGPGSVNAYNPVLYGIPVTPGTAYTFSIYSSAKTTLRSISVGVLWHDKLGNSVAGTTVSSANNAVAAWTRIIDANRIAPDYAVYAVPYVRINSPANSEVHYFDAAQFEASATATTYKDSRRVDVYLNAPRVNEIINPGFELDTANWSTTGTSAFATDSTAGNVYPTIAVGLGTAVSANSAKLTANSTSTTLTPSSTIAVTAGIPYAISAYIKAAGTNTATITVVWKNAGGTTLQTDTSSTVTLSTSFTRVSLTPVTGSATQMYAPATAATATITFTITGANGNVYYVDSILFEASASVNPYFDGGTGYNVTDDLIWEQNAAGTKGTASTGRSLYYPNRLVTQSRLKTVLSEYLPIGTNYAAVIGKTIA